MSTSQMSRPTLTRRPDSQAQGPAGLMQRLSPLRWWRRWFAEEGGAPLLASRDGNAMLPVLIEVFAGFSKLDGAVQEDEIESSLGYLRYDYSGTLYADLRRLYFEALQEPQDLAKRASELAEELTLEQKILLCVQLYLLISRSLTDQRMMVEFYLFMTNLGIAAQAIDIVYQLNSGDKPQDEEFASKSGQPLETLRIGSGEGCDVLLRSLSADCSVMAYRYQNLLLLKNTGAIPVLVRSRRLPPGDFSRLYPAERVVLEDVTLDFNDLASYFQRQEDRHRRAALPHPHRHGRCRDRPAARARHEPARQLRSRRQHRSPAQHRRHPQRRALEGRHPRRGLHRGQHHRPRRD